MRSRLSIVLPLLLSALPLCAQNRYDSISKWLDSLDGLPVEAICARTDSLISQSGDDLSRARVAAICYDRYQNSPIMGYEAVAVHIADRYFLSGTLEWPEEDGKLAMEIFAEFNRSSLVGALAPDLTMENIEGGVTSVMENPDGEYTCRILYFYDTHCSNCRTLSARLSSFLSSYEGERIRFYAIYTQSDRESWQQYARTFFEVGNPSVEVINLWDPEAQTGYHRLYNVISTPQLFFVDRTGTIAGRRLDCDALQELLGYENGASRSNDLFFEDIFSGIGPVDEEAVCDVVDAFYRRTGATDGLFRPTMFDLYRHLCSRNEYVYAYGAAYLAEKYIVNMPDRWEKGTVADAVTALDLWNRNAIGEKAADLILSDGESDYVSMLRGGPQSEVAATVLYFYDTACEVCAFTTDELSATACRYKDKGVRFIAIYTGSDFNAWKEYSSKFCHVWRNLCDRRRVSLMYDKYDLRSVPAIYLLDSEGKVEAKGINPIILNELLNN